MSDSQSNKKRLALFLDGTWNTVQDNTNIWRLRSLIAPKSLDGLEQRSFYSTGLGTKFGEKYRGGIFGRGIDTAITSAYEWLVDNYQSGDEIFIFGFSRGAYTARSLSGFISKCGLLRTGAPLGVNQLYKRYRRRDQFTVRKINEESQKGNPNLSFEEKWIHKHSDPVNIKFIGVFDTVGALGVPFPVWRSLKGEAYPFLNTGLRRNYEYAFHALAIDEHRKSFSPTLWTNFGAENAKLRPIEKTEQRWFVGAHANVGGGCFSDVLAELPVKWLADKASGVGLSFTAQFAQSGQLAEAGISDSFAEFMYGLYRLSKFGIRHHRGIGIPPAQEGPNVKNINETIDSSVFERWRSNPKYRPKSLERWAEKWAIDPAKIRGSVFADDPSSSVPD